MMRHARSLTSVDLISGYLCGPRSSAVAAMVSLLDCSFPILMLEPELCLSVTVRAANHGKCTLILRRSNSSLLCAKSDAETIQYWRRGASDGKRTAPRA